MMAKCDMCKFRKECESKRVLDKHFDSVLKAIIESNCNQFEAEV